MEIGFIYALGAAITWGLVYSIDQKILYDIEPLTLVFIDAVISIIIMLPFLFFSKVPIKDIIPEDKFTIFLLILSVALATLANFFIFSGIKELNASVASIMEIAYPFFVIFFSFLLYKHFPNIYFFIGGLLIFIGSVIIIRFA